VETRNPPTPSGDAAHVWQYLRQVEELENNGLIRSVNLSMGNSEQERVTNLTGGAGNCDALRRGDCHVRRVQFGCKSVTKVVHRRQDGATMHDRFSPDFTISGCRIECVKRPG
jgi:hypothetical protein